MHLADHAKHPVQFNALFMCCKYNYAEYIVLTIKEDKREKLER